MEDLRVEESKTRILIQGSTFQDFKIEELSKTQHMKDESSHFGKSPA